MHGRKQRNGLLNNICRIAWMINFWQKLKDNNLKDEMFLRMIEAMYGEQETKLQTSLVDYDNCANLGFYFYRNYKFGN